MQGLGGKEKFPNFAVPTCADAINGGMDGWDIHIHKGVYRILWF